MPLCGQANLAPEPVRAGFGSKRPAEVKHGGRPNFRHPSVEPADAIRKCHTGGPAARAMRPSALFAVAQKSLPTTSPPFRVASAENVATLTDERMNRTEPSPKSALTPAEWNEYGWLVPSVP